MLPKIGSIKYFCAVWIIYFVPLENHNSINQNSKQKFFLFLFISYQQKATIFSIRYSAVEISWFQVTYISTGRDPTRIWASILELLFSGIFLLWPTFLHTEQRICARWRVSAGIMVGWTAYKANFWWRLRAINYII